MSFILVGSVWNFILELIIRIKKGKGRHSRKPPIVATKGLHPERNAVRGCPALRITEWERTLANWGCDYFVVWGQFCFLSENSMDCGDLRLYRLNIEAHFGKISKIDVYSLPLISGETCVVFEEIAPVITLDKPVSIS